MDIGRMRHRITIQDFREIRNEWNEVVEDWVTLANVWASVEPLVGKEFWAKHQTVAELTHRVTIRYMPGIKPSMRVLFNGRVFELVAPPINWRERNEFLQLMCKEVVR